MAYMDLNKANKEDTWFLDWDVAITCVGRRNAS